MKGRVAVGLCAGLVAGVGLCFPVRAASRPPSRFDADVSQDPSASSGEPVVAINPSNPHDVIVTYTQASLGQDLATQQVPSERNLEGETQCGFAVSRDGGATWERRQIPITDPTQLGCADPFPVFDAHGTAHLIAGVFGPAVATGEIRMISSTDGGSTWSTPVVVAHTLPGPGDPANYVAVFSDRPWVAVDDSTGTLYGSVVYHAGEVGQSSDVGDTRYVTASTNGGATWGPLVPVGSSAEPGGDGPISAAAGTVAVAYNASATPGGSSGPTPVVFALSRDRGATFTQHATPITGTAPQVAADPAHPGTYAVLALDASTGIDVWVTRTYGASWTGPSKLTGDPDSHFKAWISYAPTGTLGVVWRTKYADGSYDLWAADAPGSAGFTAPVRLSSARSPAPAAYYAAGDDFSSVTLTGQWLYAGWGDWRSGTLDAWWGGYRLSG